MSIEVPPVTRPSNETSFAIGAKVRAAAASFAIEPSTATVPLIFWPSPSSETTPS